MKSRFLSEDEQRLLMQGLALLRKREADQLYGRLHPSDGKRLLLIDLQDQTDEVLG